MVDANLLLGLVWVGCGLVVLAAASMIAFFGRPDLHVHYDDSVDPAYVSRRAGTTALLMGVALVAYGGYQAAYGFNATLFGGLLLSLLVLSKLTTKFATGWGYEE